MQKTIDEATDDALKEHTFLMHLFMSMKRGNPAMYEAAKHEAVVISFHEDGVNYAGGKRVPAYCIDVVIEAIGMYASCPLYAVMAPDDIDKILKKDKMDLYMEGFERISYLGNVKKQELKN